MVYGYIRVSSDKQTVENQRFEINKFCEKQNLVINDWIEETISGTKNYTKRQLGRLLRKVHKDDIIICSELSRLGRNLFMIMNYDQSKEIEELQLADWKYRALRATLLANNANVIWLERNVWAGNKDGIRQCQQFVINYEDSIRRRYEMEQKAERNDNAAKRLMRESEKIRKNLR